MESEALQADVAGALEPIGSIVSRVIGLWVLSHLSEVFDQYVRQQHFMGSYKMQLQQTNRIM